MLDHARVDTPAISTIVTNEPVLVFGGCYSNVQATQALLAEARRLGVPPRRMICTGDVIAYGANPRETLALIREAGIATVMGNCEESLAADAGDCGCGFRPMPVTARTRRTFGFTQATAPMVPMSAPLGSAPARRPEPMSRC